MGLFDVFKSTPKPDTTTDGYKLFLLANEGINQLTGNYKDLSNKGKFEALIFNGLTLLYNYNEKFPGKADQTNDDFYFALFAQARKYGINFTETSFMKFVNGRVEMYSREMANMQDARSGSSGGYMPVNIYTPFYVTPLKESFEPSFDMMEIMRFFRGLVIMIRWVHDNS